MKFGLANIATLCAALGHPERAFRVHHRRRHERQGFGHRDGRDGAARRRTPHRALHVAPPGPARRAVRHRRPGGRAPADAAIAPSRASRTAVESLAARPARSTRRPPSSSAPPRSRSSCSGDARVDIAVLEVGLGGRLDATNVVIADRRRHHVDRLRSPGAAGRHARRRSPREKAGIIKPGIPVVCGPLPAEADRSYVRVRRARRAIVRATEVVRITERGMARSTWPRRSVAGRCRLALRGRAPAGERRGRGGACSRASTRPRGSRVRADAVRAGLSRARGPDGSSDFTGGRCRILLDAAHNPAGARALAPICAETGWAGHARLRRDAATRTSRRMLRRSRRPCACHRLHDGADAARRAADELAARRRRSWRRAARRSTRSRSAAVAGARARGGGPSSSAGSIFLMPVRLAGVIFFADSARITALTMPRTVMLRSGLLVLLASRGRRGPARARRRSRAAASLRQWRHDRQPASRSDHTTRPAPTMRPSRSTATTSSSSPITCRGLSRHADRLIARAATSCSCRARSRISAERMEFNTQDEDRHVLTSRPARRHWRSRPTPAASATQEPDAYFCGERSRRSGPKNTGSSAAVSRPASSRRRAGKCVALDRR